MRREPLRAAGLQKSWRASWATATAYSAIVRVALAGFGRAGKLQLQWAWRVVEVRASDWRALRHS